jgi:two-component system cell cycle response regulator DivK
MGQRILVVEDNAKNLKLLRDVLQFSGYDVAEARSGEEGVEMAGNRTPDLILMDLQLPGIDGVEALRLLRENPNTRAVPVVAVTAFAMENDRIQALLAGFDGYIEKPISVRALPSQVKTLLQQENSS